MLPTSIQAFTPHQRSLQEMEDITALPEATMGPTSSNSEAKPRKMRASCDACSRAKVKCDKVRPTCQRCGNMNVCCNYSPSMRLGKPRKHRNPDGTVKREVSPGSYAQLGARFDLIPRTTSHTYESSPEPTDPFYFGPSTPEFQYQDAYVTNNFSDSRSPACSEGTVSLVGAWSSDEPMMFGNPTTDMFVQMPQYLPPHTPIQGHVRSTRTHSQPELYASPDAQHASPDPTQQLLGMPQPMYPLPEKTATESPSPMLSAPLPTPPASSTLLTHDCTASAFRTLNNLYAPPLISGHTTPTLESILSTTKASVDNLYALLTCDCTSTPHFSSTINTAILKILSWFQAIARAHDNRGLFSTLSLETTLENYIPSHSTQHSNGGIDAETDCAARRTNIVLSELCRVEKLIDRFAERYCRYSGSSSSDITGIEHQQQPDMQNGVFLAMEAALRTKVRDTFRITMAVAPESVKRRMAAASRVSMAAQSSSSSSSSSRVRMNTV